MSFFPIHTLYTSFQSYLLSLISISNKSIFLVAFAIIIQSFCSRANQNHVGGAPGQTHAMYRRQFMKCIRNAKSHKTNLNIKTNNLSSHDTPCFSQTTTTTTTTMSLNSTAWTHKQCSWLKNLRKITRLRQLYKIQNNILIFFKCCGEILVNKQHSGSV